MKNNIPKGLFNEAGIYEIRNTVNNKVYVGSTVKFKPRFNGHKSQLRRMTHNNKGLQNAYHRDGESAFQFNVLQVVPHLNEGNTDNLSNKLLQLEYEYITRLQTGNRHKGYNLQRDPRNPLLGCAANESELILVDKSLIADLRYGEYNNKSKLTAEQVKQIKVLLIKGRSMGELARYFSVTRNNIREIALGRTWAAIVPTQTEIDNCILPNFERFKGKRISEAEVKQIKYLRIKGGTLAAIGRYFGRHSASDILRGRTHVSINLTQDDIIHFERSSLWDDFSLKIQINEKPKMERAIKSPKGTHLRGHKCRFAKLTESAVLAMVDLLKKGTRIDDCAKLYNLTANTIYAINTGKSWRHVTGLRFGECIRAATPATGESISCTKLTVEAVKQIKLHLLNGLRPGEILKHYPFINLNTIVAIKKGRSWRHVTV